MNVSLPKKAHVVDNNNDNSLDEPEEQAREPEGQARVAEIAAALNKLPQLEDRPMAAPFNPAAVVVLNPPSGVGLALEQDVIPGQEEVEPGKAPEVHSLEPGESPLENPPHQPQQARVDGEREGYLPLPLRPPAMNPAYVEPSQPRASLARSHPQPDVLQTTGLSELVPPEVEGQTQSKVEVESRRLQKLKTEMPLMYSLESQNINLQEAVHIENITTQGLIEAHRDLFVDLINQKKRL